MKELNLKNVKAVGRYNTIRSFCKLNNLKAVPLKDFGQTGIYNSALFKIIHDVEVLNYAGFSTNTYGRI